ncbi:MAG: amidohydrolase family protein [Bryobacteraceae bacterium]|nr:amidohydrolase family protein [Bryobacterales bacterium]NUM99988.1 amidohydrolase family protein [Bryobacteraceae bacterium]
MRRFPQRAYGSVYLSPAHPEFSLQKFDRCVRDGPMVAIGELEADKRCSVPEMDPIVECAASMKVPILQHTWLKLDGNEPGESSPYDLVEIARRHPDVNFICAHTGGDWERGIRILRDTKNVMAGIAGFDPTSGVVEMAVGELGPGLPSALRGCYLAQHEDGCGRPRSGSAVSPGLARPCFREAPACCRHTVN